MSEHRRRTLSKSSDYLDALATTLRDLGGPTTIPRELTQNADDAGNATTINFTLSDETLTVWNDGTFTDCGEDGDSCRRTKRCDLHAFRRFAGRTKAADPGTTGAFGVGFTSVYQITDAPELLYGAEHWILDEMAPEQDRLRSCDGRCSRTHGVSGTTFILPWARTASPLRAALAVPAVTDQAIADLEAALLHDAHATLLFLQHVNSVEVVTPSHQIRVTRSESDNLVAISDGTTSTQWITLTADFATEAASVVADAAGLINPERSANVTIALPIDAGISSGVLYATLPTQTPSCLPGHVNASFYPSTDRKTVRFETGYDSEWNRAAIAAVARGLASSAGNLADALGIPAFWEILGAITDLEKRADPELPNHAATYLSTLRQVVPDLPLVDVIDGSRERPKLAMLPADGDVYDSGEALSKIGLPVVARSLHRRLHTNSMYTTYEFKSLTARHVVDRLRAVGLTEAFDPASGALTLDEVCQVLGALDLLPGKVAKVDGIADIAIVPCRNGVVAPPSRVVWPDSEEDATLFEILVEDLLIADVETIETHCPGLREACPRLDVACAARILQGVDEEALSTLSDELLDWLNRNLTQFTERVTRRQLAELPIFPTASGFAPLTKLSLPNDFRDPIEVANLVADATARDYHKLLIALGAKPLEIVDYLRTHAVPAAISDQISLTKAGHLLQLIAAHQVELEGLRELLASTPLIPCTDQQLHEAHEAHMPSPDVTLLAPELPVALTEDIPPAVLEWLGVPKAATDKALAIAVQRLASATEGPDPAVAEAVLRTLESRGKGNGTPPDFLVSQRWLPLRRGGRAKPRDVLPTNARHLYGTQGHELGLPAGVQGRYFAQLEWLGMPSSPPPWIVVAHLEQCAETGAEMDPDVYRVLSNNLDQHAVRQLKGTSCIQVGRGAFVQPTTVFWQRTPFGRWSRTLPDDSKYHGLYRPFLEFVGVKSEPGPVEIAAVLRAIHDEFRTDQVDEEGQEAIHACWTRLSELLDQPVASQVLAGLGRIRSTLDPRSMLSRPDELYFEDSRALHKRFPQLAHNVIPRVHGTWPALQQAGVRRVEELIKAKIVDSERWVDSELSHRLVTRRSALRRVLVGDETLGQLEDLEILHTTHLQVSYRAELFGHPYEIGPESADAIYLPDEHQLVYCDRASDRALARELGRAIAPDEDPGPLAMRLEPILGAVSPEDAHQALDDFGIPKLDTTEHGTVWSPTAEDGSETSGHDTWSDSEPADTSEEAPVLGTHGTQGDADGRGRAAPDDNSSGDGDATRSGSSSGESGAGGNRGLGAGERKRRVGSTDPRSGRQTRLRSYVVETDEDEGARGTIGDEAPDFSPIDAAGVARVLEYERACGHEPKELAHNNEGFDVESYDRRGELVRRIEIKSTGRQWSVAGVMLSRRQHQQAIEDGELFWLYVVENAQDEGYRIYRIQNPANRIDYFGFDGGWKDAAEPDVERDESGTPTAAATRSLLGQSPGQV